jgi:hypothetical protein
LDRGPPCLTDRDPREEAMSDKSVNEHNSRVVQTLDGRRVPYGPTLAQFRRHAELYGPACVVETARAFLSEAEVAELELELRSTGGPRQRRTTWALREQVEQLAKRGLVAAAIADTLAISDRRVREILGKSRTTENGARKRLAQAEKFAA